MATQVQTFVVGDSTHTQHDWTIRKGFVNPISVWYIESCYTFELNCLKSCWWHEFGNPNLETQSFCKKNCPRIILDSGDQSVSFKDIPPISHMAYLRIDILATYFRKDATVLMPCWSKLMTHSCGSWVAVVVVNGVTISLQIYTLTWRVQLFGYPWR